MAKKKELVPFLLFLYIIPVFFGNTINARHRTSRVKRGRHFKKTAFNATYMEPAIATSDSPETWITVFVHGIMSIQPHLTLQNVMRFIRDDVNHTTYAKTVEYMRLDPYFYLNQAMQDFGLKKIDINNLTSGHAANGIARIYDDVTKLVAPNTTSHYYTFGWSGLLSPTMRYNDSVKLFKELTHELQENFWRYGIYPKVRLVGYSHGGNVCLNIAAARQKTDPNSPLSIDELILVGVPIQTETDYLVNDPIFKKIYHFFSQKDRIQRIDFFSFNRIFSRRLFKNRNNFTVPDKLMQIDVKFTRSAHTAHMSKRRRAAYTDFKNKRIVSGKSRLLRDCSPGHLEFWFFGWSPKHYRQNFALNPLPAFITIPYVIHYLNHVKDELITPDPLIVDIRPEFDTMLIKQRKYNNLTHIFPFLSHEAIDNLSNIAHKVSVDSSFEDEYPAHVQSAFNKAKEYYKIYDDRKARSGSYKRNRRMRKRSMIDKR